MSPEMKEKSTAHPTEIQPTGKIIYVAAGIQVQDPPAGVTISQLADCNPPDTPIELTYDDGTPSGIRITWDVPLSYCGDDVNGITTGDDSGYLLDCQFAYGWGHVGETSQTFILSGLDPAKNYLIKVSGSVYRSDGDRLAHVTIDGDGPHLLDTKQNTANGVEKEVSGKDTITFSFGCAASGSAPNFSGLIIEELGGGPVEIENDHDTVADVTFTPVTDHDTLANTSSTVQTEQDTNADIMSTLVIDHDTEATIIYETNWWFRWVDTEASVGIQYSTDVDTRGNVVTPITINVDTVAGITFTPIIDHDTWAILRKEHSILHESRATVINETLTDVDTLANIEIGYGISHDSRATVINETLTDVDTLTNILTPFIVDVDTEAGVTFTPIIDHDTLAVVSYGTNWWFRWVDTEASITNPYDEVQDTKANVVHPFEAEQDTYADVFSGYTQDHDTSGIILNARQPLHDTMASVTGVWDTSHDTVGVVSFSPSVFHDTMSQILNARAVPHDSRALVSIPFTIAHDTTGVVIYDTGGIIEIKYYDTMITLEKTFEAPVTTVVGYDTPICRERNYKTRLIT